MHTVREPGRKQNIHPLDKVLPRSMTPVIPEPRHRYELNPLFPSMTNSKELVSNLLISFC